MSSTAVSIGMPRFAAGVSKTAISPLAQTVLGMATAGYTVDRIEREIGLPSQMVKQTLEWLVTHGWIVTANALGGCHSGGSCGGGVDANGVKIPGCAGCPMSH